MKPGYLGEGIAIRGPRVATALHRLEKNLVPLGGSWAERGLHSFVQGVGTLYDQEHMSFNVHSLLHLGDCVRDFGPLWASSALPYEGFMMKIKQLFSGTTHLPQQVAGNFLMMQALKRNIAAPDSDKRVSEMTAKWLGVYSLSCKAIGSREGAVGLGSGRVASLQPREALASFEWVCRRRRDTRHLLQACNHRR